MSFKLVNILKQTITESETLQEVSNYDTVEFSFRTMKPWKRKTGKPTWFVYFNDVEIVDGEYHNGENSLIYLTGDGEHFSIDSKYFDYYSKTKSARVLLNVLKKDYPDVIDKLFGGKDGNATPKVIRKALEIAFENNWISSDEIYSPGVRNIHTIGEKAGTDESWSIMNFFDTKREVQDKINKKWEKEGNGDFLYWLVDVFKNDEQFLNELIDIQWRSISNGYNTELKVAEKLSNELGGKGQFFPPGSKMDRYKSIDMIINGETYQIKPSSSVKEDNGVYRVKTYGMSNTYKTKNIDYVVYGNPDGSIYVFPNKNYDVKGHTEVEHYEKPIIY